MKKTVSWLILMAISISAIHVFAGSKKQKHKVDRKAWNPYACCHDINSITHTPVIIVENYLVPEFYFVDSIRTSDTAFTYECFDSRDSIINMDTVQDFETVKGLALLKLFTDHGHTYMDGNGQKQPLP